MLKKMICVLMVLGLLLGSAALADADYQTAIIWLEQLEQEGEAADSLSTAIYAYAKQLEEAGNREQAALEYARLGSYEDAADRVCAIEYAANHTGAEVINLGTGVGYSVLDMVKAFEKTTGKAVPYKIVGRRAGDVAECYSDPAKAKELLGWTAEYNLEDMCADSWRWQSQNPKGYDA